MQYEDNNKTAGDKPKPKVVPEPKKNRRKEYREQVIHNPKKYPRKNRILKRRFKVKNKAVKPVFSNTKQNPIVPGTQIIGQKPKHRPLRPQKKIVTRKVIKRVNSNINSVLKSPSTKHTAEDNPEKKAIDDFTSNATHDANTVKAGLKTATDIYSSWGKKVSDPYKVPKQIEQPSSNKPLKYSVDSTDGKQVIIDNKSPVSKAKNSINKTRLNRNAVNKTLSKSVNQSKKEATKVLRRKAGKKLLGKKVEIILDASTAVIKAPLLPIKLFKSDGSKVQHKIFAFVAFLLVIVMFLSLIILPITLIFGLQSTPEPITIKKLCQTYIKEYNENVASQIQANLTDDSLPIVIDSGINWRNFLSVYLVYIDDKKTDAGAELRKLNKKISGSMTNGDTLYFDEVFYKMNHIVTSDAMNATLKPTVKGSFDADPKINGFDDKGILKSSVNPNKKTYKKAKYILCYHLEPEALAQTLNFSDTQIKRMKNYLGSKYNDYFKNIEKILLSGDGQMVVDLAKTHIGKSPTSSSNFIPCNKEYGTSNETPWCVIFAWYCFRHSGFGDSIFPKTSSTGDLLEWFEKKDNPGTVIYPSSISNKSEVNIEPGWLIIKWDKAMKVYHSHTSIIDYYDPKTQIFHTVDGNQTGDKVNTNSYGWNRVYAICVPAFPKTEGLTLESQIDKRIDTASLPIDYSSLSDKALINSSINIHTINRLVEIMESRSDFKEEWITKENLQLIEELKEQLCSWNQPTPTTAVA